SDASVMRVLIGLSASAHPAAATSALGRDARPLPTCEAGAAIGCLGAVVPSDATPAATTLGAWAHACGAATESARPR
ncbi:MAG: hypothetical protein ACHREM_17210, partial [Polyangiales bacterium]